MSKTILIADDKANIRNLVCVTVTPEQVTVEFVRAGVSVTPP